MKREKILDYTKKYSKTHLTRYLKYLIKYGESEDLEYININKNGVFSICTKCYYTELYDIECLNSFDYEGKVKLDKNKIEEIIELKNSKEIKDFFENSMISSEKVYDNRYKIYSNLLTDNHKLILDYTLDLENMNYISNIMEENNDEYHSFFYLTFSNKSPKLMFKLNDYDIFSKYNNIIDYTGHAYVPYEVFQRLEELEELRFKVYRNDIKDENIYELNMSFDICKSRILCKIV